jgi:hypothetical protein
MNHKEIGFWLGISSRSVYYGLEEIAPVFQGNATDACDAVMVLPVRIELTTSPFLPLSAFAAPLPGSWSGSSLHHGPKPLGAARLISTPSPKGLARDHQRRLPRI